MNRIGYRGSLFLIALLLTLAMSSAVVATGVLDQLFGVGGSVTTPMNHNPTATSMLVQPDDKILVFGQASPSYGAPTDVAGVRYNPSGTLDNSFGSGGRVFISISQGNDTVWNAALQTDGKIVIVGTTEPFTGLSYTDFLVLRLTVNGALDESFGTGGKVLINQGSFDSFNAVAIQSDGKIVAAGRTSDGDRAAAIRFNPDGTLDRSFGNGGLTYFSVAGLNGEYLRDISILPNGRILAGGTGTLASSNGSNFLVLMEPNGTLSPNFGSNGIVTFADGSIGLNFHLKLTNDGKILVVSDGLYRFFNNGVRDTSIQPLSLPAADAAFVGDGKFVTTSPSNFPVCLYTVNGQLVGKAKNVAANRVVVGPNLEIVLARSEPTDFVITRLTAISSQGTRIADLDGDDGTDLIVYRPSNQFFYWAGIKRGSSGLQHATVPALGTIPEFGIYLVYWNAPAMVGLQAVFRGEFDSNLGEDAIEWGLHGDIPVGGDFDGDGATELTVFRPQDGNWYSTSQRSFKQPFGFHWGTSGDKPVPADYDYDGITDYAIYRPSEGRWWIHRSSDGGVYSFQWGISSDIPLTGDFDGDGKADFTVYRPSDGIWYQFLTSEGPRYTKFGISTDVPVPGDYDGDGKHDIAVFRNGIWYLLQSRDGFTAFQFNLTGDLPIAVKYDQ